VKTKTLTLTVIGMTVVALIAYDVYAIIVGGQESTISWQMIDLAYQIPFIPFAFGVLCGYFFWRARDPEKLKR